MSRFIRTYNPHILFLSETKKNSLEMERLRVIWNFDNYLAVNSIGKSGGLALLWMNDLPLEVQSYFSNHIDAIVRDGSTGSVS